MNNYVYASIGLINELINCIIISIRNLHICYADMKT